MSSSRGRLSAGLDGLRGITTRSRALPWLAGVLALSCVALYLAHYMTMSPYHVDEGLIIEYVQRVAQGERSYFDFVDVYGPIAWTLPARAFAWSGDHAWGTRVFLLVAKTTSVALTFVLVLRLSSLLYAVLASLWMTVLLGWPSAYVHTAYPFHQTLPLTLATCLLLLVQPLPRRSWNLVTAGLATTLAIWMKLNAGLFVFAAGLLYCFCWMPPEAGEPEARRPRAALLQGARWLGVAVYGLAFGFFLREHFGLLYLIYLGVPLAAGLAAAALEARDARLRGASVRAPLRAWGIYLGTVLAASTLYVVAYFGIGEFVSYARELTAILSHLDYATSFPWLGPPEAPMGLNENYWLQLPCAVTLVFLAWWLLPGRRFGPVERAPLHGLWIFVALGNFVLYPRSDLAHIYQALVPAVPALFVYLGGLEGAASERWGRPFWLRSVVAVAALAYTSTLAMRPSLDALSWERGEWSHEVLRHLRYQPAVELYRQNPQQGLRDFDAEIDAVATHIDRITEDGAEVLVLSPDELINTLSHTRPSGGRHRYLFYLLKVGLLQPESFRALIPPDVIDELIAHPPALIVAGGGGGLVLEAIPELVPLIEERYRVTRRFDFVRILELR